MFSSFFRPHKFRGNLFRHLYLASSLIALLALAAHAQTSATDGSTPLGLLPGAPAGSYALSGFESINPYDGESQFSSAAQGNRRPW